MTDTDQLAKALAGLQAHCGGVKKTGRNPHFRSEFTTLADAWSVVRPALPGLGLAIVQFPLTDLPNGLAGVRTELMHESGQSRASDLLLPIGQKATAQSVGSAITYARRYSLLAICGVADDDDDGHAATQAATQSRTGGAQRAKSGRSKAGARSAKKNAPPALRREIHARLLELREYGGSVHAHDALAHLQAHANSEEAQDVVMACTAKQLVSMASCDHASATKAEAADGGPPVCGSCGWRDGGVKACKHDKTEAHPQGLLCLRCGFVMAEDEPEPVQVAEAMGVSDDEVPF